MERVQFKMGKFLILTFVCLFMGPASAQGLNFADDGIGQVIVSPAGNGRTQIDIANDAAKKLFANLSADESSQKRIGKNPAGEIVQEVYMNNGLTCVKNLRYDDYHCEITMSGGRILDPVSGR
jgi:hypothetical protein